MTKTTRERFNDAVASQKKKREQSMKAYKLADATKETILYSPDGLIFTFVSLEPGSTVWAQNHKDNERIPVPVGYFDLKDGRVFQVKDEGILWEIFPKGGPSAHERNNPKTTKEQRILSKLKSERK